VDALDDAFLVSAPGSLADPSEQDRRAAKFFEQVRTAEDYQQILDSMTKSRIRAAETFAMRWAQLAVREHNPEVLLAALLAASVGEPVSAGWDDATYSLAAVIRASQIMACDARRVGGSAEQLVGKCRIERFYRMAEYKTPILEVAGLREFQGATGWQIQ